MATYKVIQDIEAEDKLLGPLTLRQFIYAAIVAVSGFIVFKLVTSTVWWVSFLFIPHMTLFAMLAAPFGHDQPSEVWLLAKIRFFLKPRRRIWDQDGARELVTITAPKRVERQLTNNLTQTEVKSRLEALASTIDSRGWAVKNMEVNMYTAPGYTQNYNPSDRLIDVASLPQEVPTYDTQTVSDMFDETTSATAQNLTQMMNASSQAHHKEIREMMQQGGVSAQERAATANNGSKKRQNEQAPPDYWFMNEGNQGTPMRPGYATFDHNPVVAPGVNDSAPAVPYAAPNVSPADEAALLQQIREERSRPNPMNSRLKTIQPLSHLPDGTYQTNAPDPAIMSATDHTNDQGDDNAQPAASTAQIPTQQATPQRDPAILMLANNDDLNVATLAREANKARQLELSSDDEVVISLH